MSALNLSVLRCATTATDQRTPSPEHGLLDIPLTRRSVLGGSVVLGASSSSVLELLDRITQPIEFRFDGKTAIFRVRGIDRWTLDPSRFAGNPRLAVQETLRAIGIQLTGARLPGTNVPADLRCEITKGRVRWGISLQLTLGAFAAAGDLGAWLLGEQPLSCTIPALGTVTSGPFANPLLRIRTRARVEIRPDWDFGIRANGDVWADGGALTFQELTIGLPQHEHQSLAEHAAPLRTKLSAIRGECDWSAICGQHSLPHVVVRTGRETFNTLEIESHESVQGVTNYFVASSSAASGGASLGVSDVTSELDTLELPLRNLRYAGADGQGVHERAIVAGQAGSIWFDTPHSRLKLGDDPKQPVVEILESVTRGRSVRIKPVLEASITPIAGAIALAATPHTRIHLPVSTAKGAELCPACHAAFDSKERREPCHIISVLRPHDLFIARFELINLHIRERCFREPRLERADAHAAALLVVNLPPQHVAERAFFDDERAPEKPRIGCMESRLACESRLVFRLRDEIQSIPYTLAALLDWNPEIFEAVKVPATRDQKDIAPTEYLQTDIEFPWRLHLSPDDGSRWLHSATPLKEDRRAELWHTRLISERPWQARFPTIRAVWNDRGKLLPSRCPDGVDPTKPFRTSLTEENRAAIVTATHDTKHDPAPVNAHLLALSSLGAWSDLRGEWLCTPTRACDGLERWLHVATMGRDQKVVIEERGFVIRPGHKANLVTETTREYFPITVRIDGTDRRMFVAFLRQRMYLKIKEPRVVTYENWDMHHRSLEILDERTPFLNDPAKDGGGAIKKSNGGGTWEDRAFWPTVGGSVFKFRVRGVDYSGNVTEWEEPFLFVKQVCDEKDGISGFANTQHLKDALDSYNASSRRRVAFDGRTLAIARSIRKGDTELTVVNVDYNVVNINNAPANQMAAGYLPPDSPAYKLHLDPCEPPFWPAVDTIAASIPAVGGFLGSSKPARWHPLNLELDGSFESFATLAKNEVTDASFETQSDRSGGGLAPTPAITHLSRRYGPVGLGSSGLKPIDQADRNSPATATAPSQATGGDFFKDSATILGSISLKEIVAALDPDAGSVPALQSLLTEFADGPDYLKQSLSWSTKDLQEKSFGILAFEPTPDKTQFTIDGSFSVILGEESSARFSMEGRLDTFAIRIGTSEAGARVHFDNLLYQARSDGTTSFDVVIENVEFLGILAFVQKLAAMLKEFLKDTLGVEIELQKDGLNVWMPPINLEKITFGVVTMKNLNIRSWVRLPFRPNPVELGFSFGRADAPCELMVGIYGGTAYVLVLLDSEKGGIRRFEAAFEFGILREVSFGPAHGRVYLLGGAYFGITQETDGRRVVLRAYVRAGGSVDVLQLITAYIDLYIGLRYESSGASSFLVGEASLTIGFKIAIVSHSATLRRTERIAGSAQGSGSAISDRREQCLIASLGTDPCGDPPPERAPRFEDAMPEAEFIEYWEAFELSDEEACGA